MPDKTPESAPAAIPAPRFEPGDLAVLKDRPGAVGRVVAVAVADGGVREAVVYWPTLRATSRHAPADLARPPVAEAEAEREAYRDKEIRRDEPHMPAPEPDDEP